MRTLTRHFQTRRLRNSLLYTGVVLASSLVVMPNAWALQVSPTTLNFQVVQGGNIPPSQTVKVFKNTNNNVIWTSKDTAAWVSVTPTMGMITHSAQVAVSVNPAGLAVGTYTATMTITTANGAHISLPLTLIVTTGPSSPPSSSSTATLTWNASTSPDVAGYKVHVGTTSGVYGPPINVGNVLTYQVTNLQVNATYYFAVTDYNTTGVESGFSNEVSKSIQPTSTSTSGFSVSPPSLAYTGTVGGPNLAGSVNVANTGTTALTVTWADSINWLIGIQPSVTQTIQPGQSGTFTLMASTAGLTAGITYSGTATITGGGITKSVPVTLTVTN